MNAQYEKMLVLQEYQNQAQEGKVLVEMVACVQSHMKTL